jgi:hypothetical protein
MSTKKVIAKDRALQIRRAWAELAPDATVAGMSLQQFETEISSLQDMQNDVLALITQLEGKRADRSIEEERVKKVLALVVNSIKGSPEFGPDSGFYRSCGFIRASDRKSGLHRLPATPVVIPSGIVIGGNNETGGVSAA